MIKKIIKEIEELKSNFRILKDWKIDYMDDTNYVGEVTRNTKKRIAMIYGFGSKPMPVDFLFHEILHICMAEIIDTTIYKLKREKEEKFIQDLCRIRYK